MLNDNRWHQELEAMLTFSGLTLVLRPPDMIRASSLAASFFSATFRIFIVLLPPFFTEDGHQHSFNAWEMRREMGMIVTALNTTGLAAWTVKTKQGRQAVHVKHKSEMFKVSKGTQANSIRWRYKIGHPIADQIALSRNNIAKCKKFTQIFSNSGALCVLGQHL